MMKFFAEEPFTEEETVQAVHDGTISVPSGRFCCSTKLSGVAQVLDIILSSYPSYTSAAMTALKPTEILLSSSSRRLPTPLSEDVFLRVMTGTLTNGISLKTFPAENRKIRPHIYNLQKQNECTDLACGDIGMTAKLADTSTNDTLSLTQVSSPFKR